jgi:hypothetical protein
VDSIVVAGKLSEFVTTGVGTTIGSGTGAGFSSMVFSEDAGFSDAAGSALVSVFSDAGFLPEMISGGRVVFYNRVGAGLGGDDFFGFSH